MEKIVIQKDVLPEKKIYIEWLFWLFLVVIWNYGYPEASPFFDVLVAVVLSLIFIFIKKYRR